MEEVFAVLADNADAMRSLLGASIPRLAI